MAKIILDFYHWSEKRVKSKFLCKVLVGHHFCYPSINDPQCRRCYEEEHK